MIQPSMKKHYFLLSDGEPIPVGWHCLICPEGGFSAAINNQLSLNLIPYLTVAGGIMRGFEIFEKERLSLFFEGQNIPRELARNNCA